VIEESAQVVALDGEFAWVETQRRSSCGTCSSEKGCSTSAMSKLLNQKPLRVRVQNPLKAAVGDGVVIGLQDSALVRSSLVVYLLPLLAMIAGALVVRAAGGGDGIASLAGLAGLAAGFLGVRTFGRRAADNPLYQAVILRLANGTTRSVPLQFIPK
jgi:sigma-E factor negative regulatory protein RseC